jgi:methionine synthase I (cobalamin-dependent)
MVHRIMELIQDRVAIFDGGMGSMLIARGLAPGESPEMWNLEKPEAVAEIHRLYFEAGSDVVHTNTFGGNPIKLAAGPLADRSKQVNRKAAELAKRVCPPGKLVAGDLGPTGKFLEPVGGLSSQAAEDCYRRQAEALLEGGADLVSIETMYSLEEALAALRAVKSLGKVFVIAALTYQRTPRGFFTLMGEGVAAAAQAFREAGADALGSNCTLGSQAMIALTLEMRRSTRLPILIQPNAGKPQTTDEGVVYAQTPGEFAADGLGIKAAGADMIGGCCGTDPDFIRELARALAGGRSTT